MELMFHKMHGLGNDFVLLDFREQKMALSAPQIRQLTDRRTGIGCDQVLILEASDTAGVSAKYRIFNQDGSSAEHCGNGVRCVAKYLSERLIGRPPRVAVEIDGSIFQLEILVNGDVRVDMGPPIFDVARIPTTFSAQQSSYLITVEQQNFEIGVVSMGNPHAVFVVENVMDFDVATIGRAMQSHSAFPNQVNAGFMQLDTPNMITLRVWERGAGETQACGTGACAAVVIGRLWGKLDEETTVNLPGGSLSIAWRGGMDDSVWMTGKATYVFEGRISL